MSARRLVGLRRPAMLLALGWLAALVLGLVVAVPVVSPFGPAAQDLSAIMQGPSAAHWLGTDALGRDLLTRLAYGARVTLGGALLAAGIALAVGTIAGLVAGHFGRWTDTVLTWIADGLTSIPVLVILLSVAAVTGRDSTILMVALGVLFAAPVYRIVRASTLNVRGELYITAARTSGLREGEIIVRHELPRIAPLILVQASIVLSLGLIVQIGLGFLGLDAAPPDPSWGNLVKDAAATVATSIWPLLVPTFAVAATVLAISAVGDVVERDLIGGRTHRGYGSAPAAMPSAISPESDAVLSIRDLSVAIERDGERIPLISGVTLSVGAGEVVGLVGESGAGKSVTARAALGILPPGAHVSGSIRVVGAELVGAGEHRLERLRGTRIAYISQEPMAALSPSFRIGSQLREIVRTHRRVGGRAARTAALDLLRTVGIDDPETVAQRYPHQISGGMAQRVMIAIAIAGDPAVLVADEPTTALDVSVQMQILDLLRRLQRERGLAVLLVTHDWGVVADLCDRAVAMYAGEIVEEAPLESMFRRARHPYSLALRAADPHAQPRGGRLTAIPGSVPPPGGWPVGCRFASRCELAAAECRDAPVELRPVAEQHLVRCIRAADAPSGAGHD